MKLTQISDLFRHADAYELQLCHRIIRWSEKHGLIGFFKIISRLGDGLLWYALLLILFVLEDMETGTCLALTGLACTLLYKTLKAILARERPCITHLSVHCAAKPLDRYSFTSGHTLHAVCFCTVFTYVNPIVGLVVLPFTIAVAISRVVLGLHYPSDVAAGAVIGIIMACSAIAVYPF